MSFWKVAFGVGCGILLAIAAVFMGCSMLIGWGMFEQQKALEAIQIRECAPTRDGDWVKVTGSIWNGGDDRVEFVKVAIEWQDGSRSVIDTDWTYAVGAEGLAPRQSSEFSERREDRARRVDRARCRIMTD